MGSILGCFLLYVGDGGLYSRLILSVLLPSIALIIATNIGEKWNVLF